MLKRSIPVKSLELDEARYWSSLYLSATRPLQKKLGLEVENIEGTICLAAANMDVLAFNRAIGGGLSTSLSPEFLFKVVSFYRSMRVSRFFLQLCPDVLSPEIYDMLTGHGYTHYNNWCKHYRDLFDKQILPENGLSVEMVQPNEVNQYAGIINQSFDFGYDPENLVVSTYGQQGYHFYLARDLNKVVAAAGLCVYGEHAQLTLAGTLPEARNRGAQGLLINKRINDAIQLGCRYISTETSEDLPEKPSASFRNMVRYGFIPVYIRQNFIYQF